MKRKRQNDLSTNIFGFDMSMEIIQRLKNWNLNEPFEKLNSQTIECWSNQTNFQLWLIFIHYQNRSKKSECGRRIRLALRHSWYNLNHHKWDQLLWFYLLFHINSLDNKNSLRHRMDQNNCRNACLLDFHRLNRWKMLSTVKKHLKILLTKNFYPNYYWCRNCHPMTPN